MFKMLTAALALTFSVNALAATQTPQNLELCSLEIESETEQTFTSTQIFDIKKDKTASAFIVGLVENHFASIYEQTLTFAEIQAQFGPNGDNEYNDLYVNKLRSMKTGKIYYEVKSYPGDNPYGAFYNLKGEVLATNGDDSITLITKDGEFSCYEINKDKYE